MKLARYVGGGRIEICEEPQPACPEGGLLVKTLASGLCSGELMDWYMDKKIPHVLGHEVCGRVVESKDSRFYVGSLVFPHHHAPCLNCAVCRAGKHVHCEEWKRSKLIPGGMAELFAVPAANLNDTHVVNDLRPIDAALIEPLACVAKSLSMAPLPEECAVIGLGALGLIHMFALRNARYMQPVGYDLNPERRGYAAKLGFTALDPSEARPADNVFVCPGSAKAINQAIAMTNPGGTVVAFAPVPPGEPAAINLNEAYFKDLKLVSSYSCGPHDTERAVEWIRAGYLKAEHVVSDFTGIDELPEKYLAMKAGDILKAMVVFD